MARAKPQSQPRSTGATKRATRGASGVGTSFTLWPVLMRFVVRFVRFATPRSWLQLLTLALGLLAAASAGVGAYARIRGGGATAVYWAVVLVAAAGISRLTPVWLPRARALTLHNIRRTMSMVLLLAALALVTADIVAHSLGSTTAPLLGPLAGPWTAYPFMALLLVLGTLVSPAGGRLLEPMRALRFAAPPLPAAGARVTRETWIDHELPSEPEPDDQEEVLPSFIDRRPSIAVAPPRPVPVPAPPPTETEARTPLLPPIDVFTKPDKAQAGPTDLDVKARTIERKLASFGVGARVVGYHVGPTVTLFDVEPDVGVKVRRITELQNDLALALAAPTIRIQAPVPGRPVVGIEIPNSSATMVTMREILESEAYRGIKSPLRVVMGKDVTGSAVCIDLGTMPHLLIAGATGSGKSVCLNVIISCLLYQNTPRDVRLLMVDPKMVELTVYNGVPHLLSPVVTEMDKVVGVLRWAIREMERRYALFRDAGVRNLARYNQKLTDAGERKLPYIVLVIDELADLMMMAPDDVEEAICRLAQLARATGIHLVIATQRPSVDVITGLIKANFPARIAFAMSSQVDSRTILDAVGAEKLLGRGDMLYQDPREPKPARLQGAHVSDNEIERLVEFWRDIDLRVDQVSEAEFAQAREEGSKDDALLEQAIEVVSQHKRASVSLLQRHLSVGYQRAARIMDLLEERGVVGPADGGKSRLVYGADDPPPDDPDA